MPSAASASSTVPTQHTSAAPSAASAARTVPAEDTSVAPSAASTASTGRPQKKQAGFQEPPPWREGGVRRPQAPATPPPPHLAQAPAAAVRPPPPPPPPVTARVPLPPKPSTGAAIKATAKGQVWQHPSGQWLPLHRHTPRGGNAATSDWFRRWHLARQAGISYQTFCKEAGEPPH